MHTKTVTIPATNITGHNTDHYQLLEVTCKVTDLPLDLPLGPNARYPDAKAPSVLGMLDTLEKQPELFQLMNKGMFIVAGEASIDGDNVTITLQEREQGTNDVLGHGLLDGGHTLAAIRKARTIQDAANQVAEMFKDGQEELKQQAIAAMLKKEGMSADKLFPNLHQATVKVRIAINCDAHIAALSRGRNTQRAVADIQLANLEGRYQSIGTVLGINDRDIKGHESRIKRAIKLLAAYRGNPTSTAKHVRDYAPTALDASLLSSLKQVEVNCVASLLAKENRPKGTYTDLNDSKHKVPQRFVFEAVARFADFFRAKEGVNLDGSLLELWNAHGAGVVEALWSRYQESGAATATVFFRNDQEGIKAAVDACLAAA